MIKTTCDLLFPEFIWVTLSVEEYESLDPRNIGFFSPEAIVADPYCLTNQV
jgi:hypothetical protein